MMRRRADSRASELALTTIAVVAVVFTWTLITLQLVIMWLWAEIFADRQRRGRRDLRRLQAEQRELERRGRAGMRRARRDLLGANNEKPSGRLLRRTTAAVDDLGPAVEAVAAAWQRGRHAAAAQAAELAGRPQELVSDADREQVIAALQLHMVDGRLTIDEFEQRVGMAHSARTRADLARCQERLPRIQA